MLASSPATTIFLVAAVQPGLWALSEKSLPSGSRFGKYLPRDRLLFQDIEHLGGNLVAAEGRHQVDPLHERTQLLQQLLRHFDAFAATVRTRQAHPLPRLIA